MTHLTEVKLKGYPGEVTLGFLNDRMDKLPKADVVVLDIGCNDVDQPPQSNDPTVGARNTVEIVKIFLSKYGVKYVVVCKATFRRATNTNEIHKYEKIQREYRDI